MENTINFIDFGASKGSQSRLAENEFSIYRTESKNNNDVGVTFNQCISREFIDKQLKFFKMAENTLTGDIFIVFVREDTGADCVPIAYTGIQRSNIAIRKKTAVEIIAKILKVDLSKKCRHIFNISENVSKNSNVLTYKIIK